MEPAILVVDELEKTYSTGGADVAALRGASFELSRGDFAALMGPSGCGKTTLLHIVGAMDTPTAGRVLLDGLDLGELDEDERAAVRRKKVGFVFQFFNLLPTLTLRENVALPLLLEGRARGESDERAGRLLERVGLAGKEDRFPAELSGGEMQRVAVSRAVVGEPDLVIADEPTGSLDTENGRRVLELLAELNRDLGITLLVATHSEEVAGYARRRILVRDGKVERIVENDSVPRSP